MVISIIISIGDGNEEKNFIFGQNFVWRCPDRHCNGHDRFAAKFCRWRRDRLERPFEQIDSFISVDDCSFLQCRFIYHGIYIRWSKIHSENINGQHCFPHRTRYLPTHQFFASFKKRSAGQRNYCRIAGRNRERSRLEKRRFKRWL